MSNQQQQLFLPNLTPNIQRRTSRIPVISQTPTARSDYDPPDNDEYNPNYTDKWKFQLMTINKKIKSLADGQLFTDPYFDINDKKNNLVKNSVIKWMRPMELIDRPRLGINFTNYRDVIQGQIGDCSLIASCCVLSKYPFLLKNIFEKDIEIWGPLYKGYVKIRFWINDQWIWICIDDRIPLTNGALCYGRCAHPEHFWVALIEKAYAKFYGSYEAIIGLDSATVLINLTGGVALRLNPTLLSDREAIFHYLNKSQEKRVTLAIAGAELLLNKEHTNGARLMKKAKDKETSFGHAYAFIDTIYLPNTKTHYIKLRNCQLSLKIYKEIMNKEDLNVLETILTLEEGQLSSARDHNDILCFSYDEFFEYFEVFSIIVILDNYLPGNDSCSGGYLRVNCVKNDETEEGEDEKLIEKYLKTPHFYFNLMHKGKPSEPLLVNCIINLVTDFVNTDEFIGIVILPIREKIRIRNNQKEAITFVNYTIHRQKLCSSNPLCFETKLLTGKYLMGIIVQSKILPKRYSLRVATNTPSCQILRFQELVKQESDHFWLSPTNSPNSRGRLIKIILSRCNACGIVLDQSYISSGARAFCDICYDLTFKCDICNTELGQVYYTLEERLCCEACLVKYTEKMNLSKSGSTKKEHTASTANNLYGESN